MLASLNDSDQKNKEFFGWLFWLWDIWKTWELWVSDTVIVCIGHAQRHPNISIAFPYDFVPVLEGWVLSVWNTNPPDEAEVLQGEGVHISGIEGKEALVVSLFHQILEMVHNHAWVEADEVLKGVHNIVIYK